jgi:putative ABC transport system permease protein
MRSPQPIPPRFFLHFFRWFCHPKLADHIEGDLLEVYGERLIRIGKRKANIKFIIDVLLLFRPGIIRPREGYKNLNTYGMYKNYFKIALRNAKRDKLRTSIHTLGLAIGIAVCFTIFNVISFSYSFDNFHPRKDNIFQLTTTTTMLDQSWPNSGVPFPLADVIREELQGVEDVAQFYTLYEILVQLPGIDKNFGRTDKVIFSDPGFFRFFEREWLAGNPDLALVDPNSVVLTETSLQKYFPGQDAMEVLGKEILYVDRDSILVHVTGVVKNYTRNTDFTFTDFISLSTMKILKDHQQFHIDNWNSVNSSSQLFAMVANNWSKQDIEAQLAVIVEKYVEKSEEGSTQFFIRPLSELHFNETYTTQRASKPVLTGLSIIGFILLVIGCLNFINLETAQTINRKKEVGIRKTLGSSKGQLVRQFLMETFMFVWFAIAISFLLVELIVLYFKEFLPEGMNLVFFSTENLIFLSGLSLVLTLMSGIYPGFILGNYPPDLSLRPEKRAGSGFSSGLLLRKNLAVVQFTLSIAFIIGILAVNKQIRFLHKRELGFDKEAVMYAKAPYQDLSRRNYNLMVKERLAQHAFVQEVSLSSEMVASGSLWTTIVEYNRDDEKQKFEAQVKVIDSDFVKVNGLSLLAGKNIREVPGEVLVNEVTMQTMGFETPADMLGQILSYNDKELQITGVVRNFHSRTLREAIRPLIMHYGSPPYQTINVRLAAGVSPKQAKEELDAIYSEFYPLEESRFAFLDEVVDRFYKDDARMQKILTFASGMAILISCMGLFGLTLFTVSRRLKELSIRKVLGASVQQILMLISKEYLGLILIAFILGSVPAWLFLDNWLRGFSYRIGMPWILFGVSGTLALVLCLLIVGLHSLNAARKNPAEILKSE